MSEQVTVKFPEGTQKKCRRGTSFLELLETLGKRIPQDVVAVKVNGSLYDLRIPVQQDVTVDPLPFTSPEGREVYRHSSSHLMAQAVKRLFPGVRLAIGPAIDEGFYYDFEYERPFTPEDLLKIENTMKEIVRADLPIIRKELHKEEAIEFFKKKGEAYKVEIIREIPDSKVSLYE
ncbi:MAG: threonine--tRNA ligase, partial [Nitrospira sp.]|nr:threonine--tRNA ligase [Nitrospira sp.]